MRAELFAKPVRGVPVALFSGRAVAIADDTEAVSLISRFEAGRHVGAAMRTPEEVALSVFTDMLRRELRAADCGGA